MSQNFSLFRGEDVELEVVLRSGEDITDWALAFHLRADVEGAGSPLVTRSTANGGITSTAAQAAAGTCVVTIPAATTIALPIGSYRYDVWRTDTGDNVVIASGSCDVLGQVRHAAL